MKQLRHENILTCIDSFASPNNMEIWLISPLMEIGSMRRILDSFFPEGISESAACPIIRDILNGLNHLHDRGIVHRALKASHVLIDRNGRAKISGFRYSCSLIETTTEEMCLPAVGCALQDRYDYPLYVANKHLNWMSPEILQQNLLGYNEKSDIYSLGVVVCEIANGLIPFSEMPNTYMLREKMKGTEPKLLDSSTFETEAALAGAAPNHDQLVFSGQKPADSGVGASVGSCSNLPAKSKNYTNRTFSDLFHEFVELCCFREADDRKSASELLQHSFIKQLKKSSNSKLSLATLVTANDMITVSGGHEDEDSLTMAMDSKMIIDEIEWDFS